jgi:hypothetical protein
LLPRKPRQINTKGRFSAEVASSATDRENEFPAC